MHWGRWDVNRHRTIYGASTKAAAYAESTAVFRSGGLKMAADEEPDPDLRELFDEDSDHGSTLAAIAKDWQVRGYMAPDQRAAAWRHGRCLYKLELPRDGWFVEITAANSIAVLAESRAEWLTTTFAEPLLTASHLLGDDRNLTTAAAGWVWSQVLDDGSLPHGIRYSSKFGTDWCCTAVWLRALDDTKDLAHELTRCVGSSSIEANDPDLRRVARLYRMRFH